MAELPQSLRPRRPAVTASNAVTAPSRWVDWSSWIVLALALLLCVAGVVAFVQNVRNAPVAQIRIEGALNQTEQEILQNSLKPLVSQGYFTADLAKIRDGALQQSWVDRVTVSRHWPHGIVVRVMPRHPIARWGSGRLLSDQGDVFSEARPIDRHLLPLLHGPSSQSHTMMQQYYQINQWFSPLGLKLRELHLTERMTWFMKFDSGLRVIVDQEQTQAKLQRLSVLAQHGLQDAWPQISAIDLRYRNGMALQWKIGRPPLIEAGQFIKALPPVVVDVQPPTAPQ
jgi:cell division protein FtsQ